MEPECYNPQNHWSQLVKGMNPLPRRLDPWSLNALILKAIVANWLRVVTPYPLGTQSGPLRPPYAPLMVALWLPYGCANVARPRNDFP